MNRMWQDVNNRHAGQMQASERRYMMALASAVMRSTRYGYRQQYLDAARGLPRNRSQATYLIGARLYNRGFRIRRIGRRRVAYLDNRAFAAWMANRTLYSGRPWWREYGYYLR